MVIEVGYDIQKLNIEFEHENIHTFNHMEQYYQTSELLQMQQVTQQSCPKCHRLIQTQRLSLHVHMCSTMQLRRSKIFPKSKIQDKDTNCICIFCGIKLQASEMEMHITNCQYRLVDCKICGKMFSFSVINKHHDLCLSRQLQSAKLESERSEQKNQNSIRKEFDKPNGNDENSNGNQFSFNSLNYGLQIIGSRLISQGSRLAERCNAFLQQNKQPALESLKKMKEHLFNKMEDIFAFIVADPNTEGLPPTKIRQITQGQYHAKNNGQQQQICAICICDFQDEEPIKILHCQHIFHPLCIDKWMKINKRCPLCNNDQLKGSK